MASERIPVTVILDDSGPINTMYKHGGAHSRYAGIERVRNVPVAFLERFVAATQKLGMRGKFTLLPNPVGLGRIDEGIPGYPDEELERFLDIVRREIVPNWDITPEILTHWDALDLASGEWLDIHEDAWAVTQDADSLTAYFVYALEILKNVDVPANGITSPWRFGREVEEAYAEAVGRSLGKVFGVKEAWYFLHESSKVEEEWARIMERDAKAGTAVVSVVGGVQDAYWDCQYEVSKDAGRDAIREKVEGTLSADGNSGRIVELMDAKQPIIMVTHWQSMFGNGHEAGLEVMVETMERLNEHYGERIEWVRPSDIAKRALHEKAS